METKQTHTNETIEDIDIPTVGIKTSSQVPLIKRLAREGKEEEMDCMALVFRFRTNTYEDMKKAFKDKEFLKVFEYDVEKDYGCVGDI